MHCTIDLDGPTWHPFGAAKLGRVWPRRQAQEISIHRWDAEQATGPTVSDAAKKAVITQLFYDVNFMHDYYYDAGFDEKSFNAQTAQENGRITPVEITVFEDRSFTFITKTPPAAVLIKETLGLESGSGEPNRAKVGRLSRSQLRSIAETKMPDLNARDVEEAMKVIAGTARSMGVETEP